MQDDFEFTTLECGHSVNLYKSPGICNICKKRFCERCLQLVGDLLVCPKCFEENLEEY